MKPTVSVVIAAFNESAYIGETLQAIQRSGSWFNEIIVVDDGSTDDTYAIASSYPVHVEHLSENKGKAAAVRRGVQLARHDYIVLLDADLGTSACLAPQLLPPIVRNEADATLAVLSSGNSNGFGLIRKYAAWWIYKKTGKWLRAPLSGQRAFRKSMFDAYVDSYGFGLEVALTYDWICAGYRIREQPIPFTHRKTEKNLDGLWHRAGQGVAICHALWSRR